jgi:sugar/nucleoside kinase (ribokinase family)
VPTNAGVDSVPNRCRHEVTEIHASARKVSRGSVKDGDADSPPRLPPVLCAVGDLLEDVVVWLTGRPRPATDTAARIFRRRGGSAANVAAFAAGNGWPARFVGRVGDDDVGDRLVGELAATGVDVRVQRDGRTGTIVVLVEPGGERTMLSDRGAAVGLTAVDRSALDDVTVLHLPAYSLTADPIGAACVALAVEAHGRGIACSVDASSVAELERFGCRPFRALMARVRPEVLFANADEADLLDLERHPWAPLVVIKDGPRPVRILHGSAADRVAVEAVDDVTDTTGAGDAFAAGFLATWSAGAAPAEAARAGIGLAASVVTQPGAAR